MMRLFDTEAHAEVLKILIQRVQREYPGCSDAVPLQIMDYLMFLCCAVWETLEERYGEKN